MTKDQMIQALNSAQEIIESIKADLKRELTQEYQLRYMTLDEIIGNLKDQKPVESLEFDVRPAASFMGSPKAWREELKPQIDWAAYSTARLVKDAQFYIVGNPLDLLLINSAIIWKDEKTKQEGFMYQAKQYLIHSTELVDQGVIYIVAANESKVLAYSKLTILNNSAFKFSK